MYPPRRPKKRSPEEEERLRLAREAFIEEVKIQMKTDPRYCWDMPHPDTEQFKSRVLNHPVLQAHYRPDLLDRKYLYQRPSKEVVEKAVREAFKGSSCEFLRRSQKDEGVYWDDKNSLQMESELCMMFFAKVKKDDVDKLDVPAFPAGLGQARPDP
jgi:hypothetical protein